MELGRRGSISRNRTRVGCGVLGLPESGWPSTGEAKARGAESQPLGPTALPQARQSGLSGDWRQASVSLHLGSPTCPETLPS